MFYICTCVDSFLSQSYVTQYVVVFHTIYIQVSGFLHQNYIICSVPLRIQLHIELHNSISSVVICIELLNVERRSCLHFYENTTFNS